MGAFKQIELDIQCNCFGWPKSAHDLILVDEAYEREVGRFKRQLNEAAERRRRDLEREVTGLHGEWQNLMGHRQYHLNHKRQLPADLLLPKIQEAHEAWHDKQAELDAWRPL